MFFVKLALFLLQGLVIEMPLRSETEHFCLGSPRDLPINQLPTNEDVINYVRLLQQQSSKGKLFEKDLAENIFKPVALRITQMWLNEGIPILTSKSVQRKVANCYKHFRLLNKCNTEKSSINRINQKKTTLRKLFDIALCKCKNLRQCRCPRNNRVPSAEVDFLRDQRGLRVRFIGGLDREETTRRQKADLRRITQIKANIAQSPPADFFPNLSGSDSLPGPSGLNLSGLQECESNADVCPSDQEWDPSDRGSCERSYEQFTNTVLAADRFGVSNRALSAILNAFQVDIGRISSENSKFLIDPKKIWRERNRVRQFEAKNRDSQLPAQDLTALYFDGRKDVTYINRTGSKAQEEHVAVVAEPGGEYLTHFSPDSSKAIDQVKELISIVGGDKNNIKVFGCDGTAVNTGTSGGIIRLFEVIHQKPVHWFICQLHGNELNLRALFKCLDGETTGPKSFIGPLGKLASGALHEMPVTTFASVSGHVPRIPETIVKELSSDQRILYKLSVAVQSGAISEEDSNLKIGPLNHGR